MHGGGCLALFKSVYVLIVSDSDWTTKYTLPSDAEVEYFMSASEMHTKKLSKNLDTYARDAHAKYVHEKDVHANDAELKDTEPKKKTRLADIVILDREISSDEANQLNKITRGYCLFATENARIYDDSHVTKSINYDYNHEIKSIDNDNTGDLEKEAALRYFEGKMGQILHTDKIQEFLDTQLQNYFTDSYGEKLNPMNLMINPQFKGTVSFNDYYDLTLEGKFGDDFRQILCWKNNLPIGSYQAIDFYLEYHARGNIELFMKIVKFYGGSVDGIERVWEFSDEELKSPFRIENDENSGFFMISLLAKGEGTLNIISLHDRHSRREVGFFIPGGERIVTSQKEEICAYFEKGDLKPPLAVYFSGYRTQEGFEGYYMMRKRGCPYILFSDPRAEGGAFYLGDAEYENAITSYIKDKIQELGFDESQLVLCGASMGTFASMYYGARLHPHAIILARPLASMGNVALNERLLRVGKFPTSLEVLRKNYGALDDAAIEKLNSRMWNVFDKANWSNTKFIVSYTYEDDYDTDAYMMILEHLKDAGVEVYAMGTHGLHDENSQAVMGWFRSQLTQVLREDYNRAD